jgi:hypothetical protein
VLDPTDPRVEWATFGKMVEEFLRGPIGAYLLEKARVQSDEAVEKLKVASPEDPVVIRALQTEIQVADSIMRWLGDAVQEGQMALSHLEEENDG